MAIDFMVSVIPQIWTQHLMDTDYWFSRRLASQCSGPTEVNTMVSAITEVNFTFLIVSNPIGSDPIVPKNPGRRNPVCK